MARSYTQFTGLSKAKSMCQAPMLARGAPAAHTPAKGPPGLIPHRACLTERPALWLRPRKSTT